MSHRKKIACLPLALLTLYILLSYVAIPFAIHQHPALEDAPRITHTRNGLPGDPLNIALVGTEDQIKTIMLAANWTPADKITALSCIRMATCTVLKFNYEDAPVSGLYLWGRKQDLAFQQPLNYNPRRRHHVRFWQSEKVDDLGRPMWFGAATFDKSVGFSHTTGQFTHHIDADVDAERNKLLSDLEVTGFLLEETWMVGFHQKLSGKNGGGDPYCTDGNLVTGIIAPFVRL